MKTLPEQIDHFLDLHKEGFRPIVVVSSGGTIVPLTKSGSPFIDNFSLGERGANSVEYFLANGYVVIFLYRSESRFPFTKNIFHHFSDRINDKLLTKIIHTDEDETTGSHTLSLQQSQLSSVQKELVQLEGKILRNVTKYRYFLPVAFRGIEEYLHLLEHLGKSLSYFGPRACFYLAAAVSDFYIPSDQLPSQDSFESRTEEEIVLALSQVPKRLGALTQDWAPNAYVVSFKLETDENILLDKARRAIDKYSVHLVVANLLHQRRDACILVAGKGVLQGSVVSDVTDERFEYEHITRDATHELYIEKQLIENIVGKHKAFIFHKYSAKYFTDVTPTTDTDSNKTEDSTKRPRDDALVMELVDKIFEQQSSLICKQVRYYLTHTNSKEDEFQTTSLAFTPPSKKNQNRVDEIVVVRKEYERRVFPLIGGVAVMAAVAAIKVYCNLNDV